MIELLDRINEAYPSERLESAKSRMRTAWKGECCGDRIPFVFRSIPPPSDPNLAAGGGSEHPHESTMLYQLGQMLDRSVLCDDYVPGLFPGLRQVTMPSIFGAVDAAMGGHDWVRPVISSPEDVYRLPEPNYGPHTMAGFMLERARYFRDATEGTIGVHIPDLQGPFSTASQLWGVQDFLLALYEHPDEVRELLRRTTEATIEYIRMFFTEIGDNLVPIHCMPDAWMPADAGICISEDLIAVVSPTVCREFIAPGLGALAREFRACYAHTCGDAKPCLGALMEIKGLRGMNFSTSETDLKAVASHTGSSWMLMPHTSPVASLHLRLLTPEEHVRLCFSVFRRYNVPGFAYVDWPSGVPAGDEEARELAKRVRESA